MPLSAQVWDALAACYDYPRPELARCALDAAGGLACEAANSEVAGRVIAALEELAAWAISDGIAAVEERYTQLFDLKPVATLNISHHILGDTYQRGALLAGLARELDLAGIPHRHDLPDYLPTLLRLVGTLDDPEDRRLLVHTIVRPGLHEVVEKLERSPGAYPHMLRALYELLADTVPAGNDELPTLPKHSEVPPCSI